MYLNGSFLLRDKGSSNGTFVNNAPLAHDSMCTLRNLDLVRFGDVQFRFEIRQQSADNDISSSTMSHVFSHVVGTELHASVSRIIPDAVLATLKETPTLVLVDKNSNPWTVALEHEERLTIGRGKENDIVVDDTATSRSHAEIFSATDGFYVRDLESRNGVFVNKVKINNPFHLSHGDRVVIGDTLVYFSCPDKITTPAGETENWVHPTSHLEAVAPKNPAVGMMHRSDVHMLTEERVRFEINMCIGCDRCMNACPIPLSKLVNIADLNYATITHDVAEHVARFTHECIMCGACVPVCPVDNHRDLLMLSLKQRLGVSWDSKADLSRIAESLPSGWTVAHLIGRLRQQCFLSDPQYVPENYLLHLVAASGLRLLAPGDVAIREGEYGRDLFLIVEGRLALFAEEMEDSDFPNA
jgi:pSer/pThr/pTyr-binding forkhead associated (FHA) protein/NAD-dependent dihydropyrimidine dehydrogenase PreA subunit